MLGVSFIDVTYLKHECTVRWCAQIDLQSRGERVWAVVSEEGPSVRMVAMQSVIFAHGCI
jgi:hypothetical protein